MPKKISLLLLLQIASVIINPNGVELITKPLNILGQVYENKFTTELFDFRQPEYWQWNVYWVIGLLAISLLGTVFHFRAVKTKANRFKLFVEQFGVGYLIALVAFAYLAATAYRNIIFLVLVFFPVLAFAVDALVAKTSLLQKFNKQFGVALCVLLFGIYSFIVSNKYYELTKSRDRFGLEVLSTFNPTGAAEFVQQNNLKGKCFSDYLTSSYLLWKLQPDFKTFIDLRDLDVFPSDFFNTFAEAVTFPDEFQKLDSVHHFNYVVLYRPQFAALHSFLFNESNFKLTFADAVACVYVKKDLATNSSSIKFTPVKPVAISPFGSAVNKILNPFYAVFDYDKFDNNLQAASYYLSVGHTVTAAQYATKSAQGSTESYKGMEMLGEIKYQDALQIREDNEEWEVAETTNGVVDTIIKTTEQLVSEHLAEARDYYQQAINASPKYAQAYLGLGAVYFQQKNFQMAIENFEHAIDLDKSNLTAYNFAAECCKYFINQNVDADAYTQRAISFYHKADKLNPNNPTIILNLGFLYFRKGDCNNTKKYLGKVSEFSGFTEEQRRSVKECLRKCGQ
jgi:tetratricopeptide (TPR) repeat protein